MKIQIPVTGESLLDQVRMHRKFVETMRPRLLLRYGIDKEAELLRLAQIEFALLRGVEAIQIA